MARVYLDTSFVSACVTTREDASSIVRRETSLEWMDTQSSMHELLASAEVVNELNQSSYPQRDEALKLLERTAFLPITDSVAGVATVFVAQKLMPAPIKGDALHVAACAVHRVDYLLSWNVRHLANPNKTTHLRTICSRLGLIPPTIVTPDLLWSPS
jgi:predicted nucleic acid-binding protein